MSKTDVLGPIWVEGVEPVWRGRRGNLAKLEREERSLIQVLATPGFLQELAEKKKEKKEKQARERRRRRTAEEEEEEGEARERERTGKDEEAEKKKTMTKKTKTKD